MGGQPLLQLALSNLVGPHACDRVYDFDFGSFGQARANAAVLAVRGRSSRNAFDDQNLTLAAQFLGHGLTDSKSCDLEVDRSVENDVG